MKNIPHNVAVFTARFTVSITLSDVVISVPVDVHYTVHEAAPEHGLPDDIVHVYKVMAVDPAYQTLIDTLTCNNDLYAPLEWEIFLRLADGHVGTPEGDAGPEHQLPIRFPQSDEVRL